MKRSIFTGITAAALCLAPPALGADLATMFKAPPPGPGFNWTGFYFGGNVGGGWATESNTVAVAFPGSGFPVGTGLSTLSPSGILGGIQGGFNLQYRSPVVIGVEGEYMWSDLTGSATTPSPTVAGLASIVNGKISDIAVVAGRAGWAANNLLFYAKAGGAWAQISTNGSSVNGAGAVTATYGTSDTRTGWTVGGGIEWAFVRNWSTKVEYQHIGFGDQAVIVTGLTGPVAGRLSNVTNNGSIDIIKAGLNYRFGWPFM